MSNYTKINIAEVEDLAPKYGMSETGESRFARGALGAQRIGLAYYKVNPGRRLGFGHRHAEDEEVYLVQSGSGRFKVGDEVFSVGPRDVVFVPPDSMRSWEAGEDGMELIAFGGHTEGAAADMDQEFWPQ
jgi:mannose-6-phosphate isomerase-like protein (cupin superfamily)